MTTTTPSQELVLSVPAETPVGRRACAVHALAIALFFFSGAAALLYQVSWLRQLGGLFGHTVHTSAMVLFSFMGGMAIGYAWSVRFLRGRNPLAAYGVIELGIAAWAVLVALLLSVTAPFAGKLESLPTRTAFCFFLLFPATSGLGATWPAMVAFLSPAHDRSTRLMSWGYALNTAGAVLGTLLATGFLLVRAGVASTAMLGALVSALCGLIALVLSRFAARPAGKEDAPAAVLPLRWWALAALSGASLLVLEVLYIRLFALIFHNSAYSFGAVVAVFILALACGAALVGALGARVPASQLAGMACGYGALAIVLSLAVFASVSGFDYFETRSAFFAYVWMATGLVALIVFPPVTLLGTLLPIAWRANDETPLSYAQIAGLTALGTFCGALGSLAACFLLPALGLWPSFLLPAGIFLVIGLSVLLRGATRMHGLILLAATCIALTYAWYLTRHATTLQPGDELLRRWESPYGWIDVVRQDDEALVIRQNLHYGYGSSRHSVRRDYRQGHLPLLLHEDPERALFLGMGTGQTASAALAHEGLREITVVELIPETVEAARYLSATNRGLVDHPRVTIVVDDARRYLTAPRTYDVVVSDLFVPWESHAGYLYTVEHYRFGLAALAEDGLFCQWLPLFQLGAGEFELIADSFASVFPHVTLWWADFGPRKPVLGLFGSKRPIAFDATAAARGWEAFHPFTQEKDALLAHAEGILSLYAGDWGVRRPEWLNTDEHPRVEFAAPVSHAENAKLRGDRLRAYFETVLAHLPAEKVRVNAHGGRSRENAWRTNRQRAALSVRTLSDEE